MAHRSKIAKPPNKKELGNAGWILIHSIAANFPEKPSDNEKYHAKAFLKAMSKLYPCKKCRDHFEKYITDHPPELTSRETFVIWACGAHNAVNKRLGKSEFPCKMNKLEPRWGDCGCQLKKK